MPPIYSDRKQVSNHLQPGMDCKGQGQTRGQAVVVWKCSVWISVVVSHVYVSVKTIEL